MVGTLAGGRKAAITNKKRHGENFYKNIGAMGGAKSKSGGFASNKVGKDGLTGPQRAKLAGSIGGLKSSRTGVKNGEGKKSTKITKKEQPKTEKKRHFFVFRRSDNAK